MSSSYPAKVSHLIWSPHAIRRLEERFGVTPDVIEDLIIGRIPWSTVADDNDAYRVDVLGVCRIVLARSHNSKPGHYAVLTVYEPTKQQRRGTVA